MAAKSIFSRVPMLLGIAAAALSLAACSSSDKEKNNTEESGDRPATTSNGQAGDERRLNTVYIAPKAPVATEPSKRLPPLPHIESVRVLVPGAKPRKPLRYQHDKQTRLFTLTLRSVIREWHGKDWTPKQELPDIHYRLTLEPSTDSSAGSSSAGEVTKSSPNLDVVLTGLPISVHPRPSKAGEKPAQQEAETASPEAMQSLVDDVVSRFRTQLEGRAIKTQLDARGQPIALKPATGAGQSWGPHTREAAAQFLLESMVIVPEEPAGLGARWQVNSIFRRGSATVSQRAEYELLSVSASSWTVSVRIRQDGEHQLTDAPGLPATTQAELIALLWRAEGELQISPTTPLPVQGKLAVEYRLHSRITTPQSRLEYFIDSTADVTLKSEVRDETGNSPASP